MPKRRNPLYVIALACATLATAAGAGALPVSAAERPVAGGGRQLVAPSDQLAGGFAQPRTATTASPATASAAGAFLTRPYWNAHGITSVFDHCMPGGYYTQDGKVCEFDGTVGLKSNGVDPNFSYGYAVTPGKTDYLYYDGHNGWDMPLSYETLLAAAPGSVTYAGWDSYGWGNTILIDHGNGFKTRYAHLSEVDVKVGQSVARGQKIGVSGNTGNSTGPHLHFGVYRTDMTLANGDMVAIDPWGWQAAGTDPWQYDLGNLWLTGNPQNPVPWAPAAPAAKVVDNSASITWSPPTFDGGSALTSYTVKASPGGASVSVPATQTSAWIPGLAYGTAYTFTVSAANAIGSGPASAASGSVTPQPGSGLNNPDGSAWQAMPGSGRDVAAGPNGSAWLIGSNAVPGGYGIYHWTQSGWLNAGGGGVAIASDSQGNPWVLNSAHAIYHWGTAGWTRIPGSGQDLAVAPNGDLWIVGTNAVYGGYGVWRWDGTAWQSIGGGAVRISVDSAGTVWVVNSLGHLYRRVGSTWSLVAGSAGDAGAGGYGALWVIGTSAVPGGAGILRWTGQGWHTISGGATRVSVGPDGLPWVVNSAGRIYSRLP